MLRLRRALWHRLVLQRASGGRRAEAALILRDARPADILPAMTGRIAPPRRPHAYPDRDIDCQQAMEDELQAAFDRMQRAGWNFGEIERAAKMLLWAQRRALEENAMLEANLAILRAMERARR